MKSLKTHYSKISHRPLHSSRCVALAVIVAAFSLIATPALAAGGLASPYGEVSHFGGFDGSGSVGGKFDSPVGFAVDPSDASTSDGNAVYVLDKVFVERSESELKLGYRLQKLSSTGVVLGTATLPIQTSFDVENFSDATPLISLAVDSSKHR